MKITMILFVLYALTNLMELGIVQYELISKSNDISGNDLKLGMDSDNVCFGLSFRGFKVCPCAENSFPF